MFAYAVVSEILFVNILTPRYTRNIAHRQFAEIINAPFILRFLSPASL